MMRAFTIAAIGLVAFVWSATRSAAGDLKIGDAAPDFSLQASNGQTYRLSDFRGKQAIVLAP
jgi:peroxiredoxin Q/BCP